MRVASIALLVVLAITTGSAAADSPRCELAVEVRGAIVETTLREHLEPAASAQAIVIDVPPGGRLVEAALRGRDGAGAAIAVTTPHDTATTTNDALGADPLYVVPLDALAPARTFAALVQPTAGRDVALVVKWIAVAAIRDGAIHVQLPAAHDTSCRGTIHARSGPGATVTDVRIGRQATRGATASFVVEDAALDIALDLAFVRPEPVAWTQREALGEGFTAEALTIVAPSAPSVQPRRVVLLVDQSRSMELVGRAAIARVADAVLTALPPGSEVQAVAFDRSATKLLPTWLPADASGRGAIADAIGHRAFRNGSDLRVALATAHALLVDAPHGAAMIVAITDGVLGEVTSRELAAALGRASQAADAPRDAALHAIVLDPPQHEAPQPDLTGAIAELGGAYVEIPVDELDSALARAASWLLPAWRITAAANARVPELVDAGGGVVRLTVARDAKPLALRAYGADGKPFAVAARDAPAAPLAQLALAAQDGLEAHVRDRLEARHVAVDGKHALVVLATTGKVARQRREVIRGGAPFTRMIETADAPLAWPREIRARNAAATRTATIDRQILQHLFELQLQPKAYQCYQRALGRSSTLSGTAQLGIEIARGEVVRVAVAGLGDAAFDACLVDAAYLLDPPLPDPANDADDRTIANYPLTFSVHAATAVVIPGDADSSSPLDIGAIKGGVARPGLPDTSTPLGNLRPTPAP